MAISYESHLLGVLGYRHEIKMHDSLDATKRYILRSLKPGSHRPAWIYRVDNTGKGQRNRLPGQYEVHRDVSTGKIGLFVRYAYPNRLSSKPMLVL